MTAKKKPNKQHDARAASFRRIAKALRAAIRNKGTYFTLSSKNDITFIAREFDAEATRLRGMR